MAEMWIRLTRKLAECLDGVDVSACREGDVLDLPHRDALLLMAEGWAIPFVEPEPRAVEADQASTPFARTPERQMRTVEQLRRVREQIEQKWSEEHERRRAEDHIREELHDSRSRIVAREQSDILSGEKPAQPADDEPTP
jgi:hypothetical protein